MPLYQCSTKLASGLVPAEALVHVCGMRAGRAVHLSSHTVHSPNFELDIDSAPYGYLYIVMHVRAYDAGAGPVELKDRNILFLSVFKRKDHRVSIGERETIAATFCFAQFTRINEQLHIGINATDREMGLMLGMRDNFMHAAGALSPVISTSPNGLETNSFPMFNFLANLLHYCMTDAQVYKSLLSLTKGSGQKRAEYSSSFGAIWSMCKNPWTNVEQIYELIRALPQLYSPSLPDMYSHKQRQKWSPVPNQWSLTVKVNRSGAQNFLISGPGYIAFDENDRLWLTNNVTQGTPNSGSFAVVLNPDGSPADFSPVFGGGLLGGGFGVCANADGSRILFGNFGWGPKQYNPQHGSISAFNSSGEALSPQEGYFEKISRAQGMKYDKHGNLWITSWGTQQPMAPSNATVYDFPDVNSAIVVYLNFDGSRAPHASEILTYEFENPNPFNCSFDLDFDADGNAFVSNAGAGAAKDGSRPATNSALVKLCINTDNSAKPFLEQIRQWSPDDYEAFRQVAVNSRGEVFVAAVAKGCVYRLNNDLTEVLASYSTNIGRPWGMVFDANDQIYVANFFPVHESPAEPGEKDVRGKFGVTVVSAEHPDEPRMLTLPTGGSPVTLANGYGTYGSGNPDSYEPLTRMTGSVIDRVGNLWAINNWKASAYVDFEANPGGDGLVIFVGAAAVKSPAV